MKVKFFTIIISSFFITSCGIQAYKISKEKFNDASTMLLIGNQEESIKLYNESIQELEKSLEKISSSKERTHIYVMKAKAELMCGRLTDASRTIDIAENELAPSLPEEKNKIQKRDLLLLEVIKAEFYAYSAIWLSRTTDSFSDTVITHYQEAISRYERFVNEEEFQEEKEIYAIVFESMAICYRGIAAEYGKKIGNESVKLQKEALTNSNNILIKAMKKTNLFRPLAIHLIIENQKDIERLNKK